MFKMSLCSTSLIVFNLLKSRFQGVQVLLWIICITIATETNMIGADNKPRNPTIWFVSLVEMF